MKFGTYNKLHLYFQLSETTWCLISFHGNNSQINDVTDGRHLGFSNFQILFKFSLLYLGLTGKTAFSGWNPRNRSNPLRSCKFLAKNWDFSVNTQIAWLLRWRHPLWRHLISVKRCVHKQGTVVPKLLTIAQGAKNLKPKKSRGVNLTPPPSLPQGF